MPSSDTYFKRGNKEGKKFGFGSPYSNKGRILTDATKMKLSSIKKEWHRNNPGAYCGSNNPCWRGGKSPLVYRIRNRFEYRQWRSDVFTRDGFVCVGCGAVGCGNLQAHHIKSLVSILEEYNIRTMDDAIACDELWNINNGQTLCITCHRDTESYGNGK